MSARILMGDGRLQLVTEHNRVVSFHLGALPCLTVLNEAQLRQVNRTLALFQFSGRNRLHLAVVTYADSPKDFLKGKKTLSHEERKDVVRIFGLKPRDETVQVALRACVETIVKACSFGLALFYTDGFREDADGIEIIMPNGEQLGEFYMVRRIE